jgi:hypothetical protein
MLRSELDGNIIDCDPYMPESVCPSGARILEQFGFDEGSLGWEFMLLVLWYVATNAIFLAMSLFRSTGLQPVQPHTDNDLVRIAAEEAAISRLIPSAPASAYVGADTDVNCDAGHVRQRPSEANIVAPAAGPPKAPTALPALPQSNPRCFSVVATAV